MELSNEDIQKILPHSYPMLMVDKVTKYEKEQVNTIKNISINEPFFKGHFSGYPVMPGVILIEAMAQAATILFYKNFPEKTKDKHIYYLTSVKSRFFKVAKPGDKLELSATPVKLISDAGIVNVKVRCGSENIANAEISFKVALK